MTAKTKSVIKYICAIVLLAFIVRHAGVEKIVGYLKQISPVDCLLALIFSSFAQLISALRMRYFFYASGFSLNTRYAIILYYVGAFYNFLLPGGIGGDAYKVILARRHMEMPPMQGIRIMVADRASGLCVVMLSLFCALYYMGLSPIVSYFGTLHINLSLVISYTNLLLLLAAIITLIAYVGFSQWLLKQRPSAMIGSLPFSLGAQLCWMGTLTSIWMSIGNGRHLVEYIAFYSGSSITGLLPVSVGGLGIKEMTYFYGAKLYGVDPDLGIALSLCIFAMTFLSALPGLLCLEKIEKIKHYP
jgi:hypothetical protein